MISLKPIRENAGSPAYTRGNQIYKKDRIRNFHCQNQGSLIETEALVEGSYDRIYHVELVYDRVEDDFLEYSCECEAYFNYSGMCKHCVGVALKLLEHEQGLTNQCGEKNQPGWKSGKKLRATDQQVSKWIRSRSMKEKSRFFQAEITGRIELIPTLHFEEPGGWKLDFRIGAENVYVVKNISAMAVCRSLFLRIANPL